MVEWRKYLRVGIAAGATVGVAVLLEVKARDTEQELKDKGAAYAQTGLTLNPLELFRLADEAKESADLAGLTLEAFGLRAVQMVAILGGGLLTLYFAWRDLIQTPAQRQEEVQRTALVTQAAVRGALGAAAPTTLLPTGTPAGVPAVAPAAPVAAVPVGTAPASPTTPTPEVVP